MNTNTILKSDILDIIFDKRNKQYGAYPLRKNYNNRLYTSIAAMFAVVCLLCSFSFIRTSNNVLPIPVSDSFIVKVYDTKPEKKEKPVEKKHEPIAKIITPINTDKHTIPIIVNKNVVAKINDLRTDAVIGISYIKAPPAITVPIILPKQTPAIDTNGTTVNTKVKLDVNIPTYTPEIMPTYPGGEVALRNFLQKNLINPQEINEGETISVKIKFIVGFDGKLKGFETVQDGGTAFNNEVIRVLKKMPNWLAGKSNGENVSVYFTIPVKFTAAVD